ncbi:MAG: EfeM/EfeO family lipoprotein [Pseudonocardia sp.]
MQRWSLPLAGLVGVAILVSGCGTDDGANTTAPPPATTTPNTGSASGLQGATGTTNDPVILAAVADYKTYADGQIDELIRVTKVFTDAVRAGNLQAAQAAYAPSREPWERIEPLAGLVEDIDGKVDSRVDDFASETDPNFTGWHRLEFILFQQNTTEGAAPFADQLDADLATLKTEFAALEIPPATVPVGASELIEEVSEGKITGEEDRYSKTDFWDFNANLEGSKAAIGYLTPALQAKDPALLAKIQAGFTDLDATLAPFKEGNGWKLYCLENDAYPSPRCTEVVVTTATVDKMKAQLASLSESVSQSAGALGLQ